MGKGIQQSIFLAILSVLAGIGVWYAHPRSPRAAFAVAGSDKVTWSSVQVLDAPLYVDARSPAEFSRGHLEGAVNLSLSDWEAGLDQLFLNWNPDQPIVVYCESTGCQESEAVAARLRRELGVDAVFYLDDNWKNRPQ